MTIGKLPNTGLIKLEMNKSAWAVFADGFNLISLPVTALVELGIKEKKEGRINIVIQQIFSPNAFENITNVNHDSDNINPEISLGLVRIANFLSKYVNKNLWLLLGYLDGKNKIPILITYYEAINLMVYTLKTDEDGLRFFDPSLN